MLRTAEIPCYPNLPNFIKIPGTFTEILTEPWSEIELGRCLIYMVYWAYPQQR